MRYDLPTSLEIGGEEFEIRTDFRVILEISDYFSDPDFTDEEKGELALRIFYPRWEDLPDYSEAIEKCVWFMDGGREKTAKKRPRVIDWAQDFDHIIAPINRVLGYEARAVPYDVETNTGGLHWWTVLAAFMEIGPDCTMSQIVNIRDKQARGKRLEKHEREWYRRNREIVDIKRHYTQAEEDLVKEWT